MELSETRLKRICEHYHQFKLLTRRLNILTDMVENTPDESQRIFKLMVALESPHWKEPKTATQIWQQYYKNVKIDRGNACKALNSLLDWCIRRVPYMPRLEHPKQGKRTKRNSSSGRQPRYAYCSTVTINEMEKGALMRGLVEDLPILTKTGVVKELCESIVNFVIRLVPNLLDVLERQVKTFPESVLAKAVEPYMQVYAKEWKKAKMAAKKFLPSCKKDLESALRSRFNELIDIICDTQS
jgi:hypothetical protein